MLLELHPGAQEITAEWMKGLEGRTFHNPLNKKLTYDPAVPLLGIHLEKTLIQKDARTSVFITALFTIANTCSAHLCPTLCDPMDCCMPGFPVHYQLLELAQTHVNWVSDAIQPSHPLFFPFPPAFNHSQHQGLFQWVNSSQQVAKILEFQLQHQSFQWIFRTDFL